jgi:hypothetical protein
MITIVPSTSEIEVRVLEAFKHDSQKEEEKKMNRRQRTLQRRKLKQQRRIKRVKKAGNVFRCNTGGAGEAEQKRYAVRKRESGES